MKFANFPLRPFLRFWLPLLSLGGICILLNKAEDPSTGSLFLIYLFFSALIVLVNLIPLAGLLSRARTLRGLLKDSSFDEKVSEWEFLKALLDQAKTGLVSEIDQLGDEKVKLSTILNSLQEGIVGVSVNQETLFSNQSFADLFLSETKQKQKQFKIWQLFRDPRLLSSFAFVLKEKKSQRLNNILMDVPLKGEMVFDVIFSPLYQAKGKLMGVVAVFRDKTKEGLAEKMRTDFVANISHDVRTPLTAIKGLLELIMMKTEGLDQEAVSYLEKMKKNTDRLTRLFNDLMDLSLVDNHLEEDEGPELIDLTFTVDNILESLKVIYNDQRQVKVLIQKDFFHFHGQHFEQILTNYLDNAFKYGNPNGEIRLEIRPMDDGLVFMVQDDGPGLSPRMIPRVFERFYRGDESRTGAKGSGLGLSIVKNLTSKHGGRAWVDSVYGQGSKFFVYLPEKSQ